MRPPGSGATFVTLRAFRSRGKFLPLRPGAGCRLCDVVSVVGGGSAAQTAGAGPAGSLASPRAGRPRRLQAHEERVEARGESAVTIVGPHILAEDGQDGEPVGWQGPEERMQPVPGNGVQDALLVGGGAVAESEAKDVVVDQGVRLGGIPMGQAG